jgi:UDP-N-acetylglucosamine--N-acetylmuramyl-(pentapeptide) pyrophosphoryl-undecaprenol N-acetylglucosamine transferase
MPAPLDGSDGIMYDVIGFEEHMETVYAAADLFVGRGGASTVCEVAAVGIPSILVPWAGSAEDHQTANVRWLSDLGGCVLVAESPETPRMIVGEIERLRSDVAVRDRLVDVARSAGSMHRSDALARLVEEVARG